MDQIRNFRDFLRLYNQISDTCFTRCTNTFTTRDIELDEANCVDTCAQKFIHTNHRVMEVYMEVQAAIVQKRIDEMNAAQAAIEAKSAEEQNVEVVK
ncbi:mitochondrial import inner membrane translocase subunit Tim10 B [Nasonia vitripennis]|uniref:Mitochondrial import inner membrane translocase subunit n=1 Tax=Nasonia vitripennis TaxID=7425 RepID=A0A7M7LR54_NASVI|nr:mitochondrial import inner membrane translocase subunit Tim10 B [Nasonia vitripennis]